MTLLVVAVAGVTDGSPYVPGRKKNCRLPSPAGGVALSAALIEATDIDGLEIVTFAPNGFVGMLVTGLGAEVHGFVVAEAVATPAASNAGTTHPTTSAVRASLDPTALSMRLRTLIDMRCVSSCRWPNEEAGHTQHLGAYTSSRCIQITQVCARRNLSGH